MSDEKIERVGVLGTGLMGSGIVHVCAQAGYEVVAREVEERYWKRAFERIGGFMQKSVEKEKMTAADREAALGRMRGTTEVADLADCDLVIEAVVEDIQVKNEMLAELDDLCAAHTIFASNTSSLSSRPTLT